MAYFTQLIWTIQGPVKCSMPIAKLENCLRVFVYCSRMQNTTSQQSFEAAISSRGFRGFENQEKVLELLANATSVIADGADYERAINCLASILVKDFATWCTIDLVQPDGSVERVTGAHRHELMSDAIKTMQTRFPASPKAKRGVYRVIETRQSILIPYISNEQWAERAESIEHLNLILELGSTSYIVVPLIARGEVVGAIMLLSGDRIFAEQDLKIAEQYATWIAMVVDNISMFRKMKSTMMALEATQNQLLHSSKLSALGVIAAGIAHEINNPLAVIRLSADKIKSMIPKSTEQVEVHFERLQNGIDRIVRIITGVNDFSRACGPTLSPLDLTEVAEKAVSLVEGPAKATGVKIDYVTHHKGVIVNGSAPRIEQVIVNVLTNSIDAIVEKKTGGKIAVGLWKDSATATIRIVDDGVGLDAELADRIFDPFFTTKGAKGSGLGLSISHGIIQDHNGQIKVESQPGKGTRVTIEIPLLMP